MPPVDDGFFGWVKAERVGVTVKRLGKGRGGGLLDLVLKNEGTQKRDR